MCLYQCWSSLDLKLFTDGDDITLSGNEFQFLSRSIAEAVLSDRATTSSFL